MSARTLLAFKAGRAQRREGTNFVDPEPTKGAIYIQVEDELLHFVWKNRSNGEVEEDLILFPADAEFVKVSEAAAGRVYVLKFSSSNQRHFFWMQDANSARDEVFVDNVNRLLRNPESIPIWDTAAASSSTSAAAPSGEQASTSTSTAPNPAIAAQFPQATPEQLSQLQQLLGSMNSGAQQPQVDDLSLTDILNPTTLRTLISTHPSLLPALFPFLPPGTQPSAEVLQQVVSSQPFRAAVRNFDMALRTGLLGSLVQGLGLPAEAGTGVEPFLRAVQAQADRDSAGSSGDAEGEGDRMDTD